MTLKWIYSASKSGAFPAGKTFIALIVSSVVFSGHAYAKRVSDDTMEIAAYTISDLGVITNSDTVFNVGRLIIIVLP